MENRTIKSERVEYHMPNTFSLAWNSCTCPNPGSFSFYLYLKLSQNNHHRNQDITTKLYGTLFIIKAITAIVRAEVFQQN